MADASPAKWHLAHTTWFFETFVLRERVAGYQPFDERYHFLFNSYYEAEGPRLPRPNRGMLTRPALDEIVRYRHHVTERLLQEFDNLPSDVMKVVELGCHHEQQHQELLQTDLLYLFAQNPLAPALWPARQREESATATDLAWVEGHSGLNEVGATGEAFVFDCELPRHRTWLTPHSLGSRLVTNAEWLEFVSSRGYQEPRLWLSDGWSWVRQNAIQAPLYWRGEGREWVSQFGLDGVTPLQPDAPVCHVSYYEADAFARWAGARLPTEAEFECAAAGVDPDKGNFLDAPGAVSPRRAGADHGIQQLFGDVWEWTGSAFLAYPGFQPAAGAIGEYNGKFMSGQFVLRGGSCATPRGHARATYRNFFYPHQRWQFTGVRLAKDM